MDKRGPSNVKRVAKKPLKCPCPYKCGKEMPPLQFLTHLTHCRRNYVRKNPHDIVKCPYNSTHCITTVEFELHARMCAPSAERSITTT
ncbi:hypothetical protein WR25_12196 [Diploscapter pachys]|uniref:CHHC U11-48K-type domain-containing protein n=1 Tax=Diploscapter pachys TaxID=2018661 RepID=A0A2A2LWM6_9BILA|nr:hypothetical protein WR25_12196 [Diploscapter pachys]